jgi:acyl-CoA-dependent ceramide synthase
VGAFFGLNIGVWVYLRHYLNLRIIFSLLNEFQNVGPYELNWETQQYKCWISNIIAFVLLSALQALNTFWLFCLLRSAYRFVVHNIAKDDRSDDEEEDCEEAGHNMDVTKKTKAARSVNGIKSASEYTEGQTTQLLRRTASSQSGRHVRHGI